MAKQGPKILTYDIETAPMNAHVWALFDQNVGLNMIAEDWAIISWASKWMDKRKVTYRDTSHLEDFRDDKEMLRELREELDEADIVVGQNVQKFDMRKVRARMIMHGLKPFREPIVQDTMLMARSVAAFSSNKLEYLSGVLTDAPKSKHNKFPGFELWREVMAGNKKAWAEMRKYNPQDVRATEKVYLALRPWVKRHPNVAQYYDDDHMRCPRCGHLHLEHSGVQHRGVSSYDTWLCLGCHGHSRSRITVNTKSKRQSLLVTC